MTDKLHRLFTVADGIHVVHAWSVIDASARLALTVGAADVGKVCRQEDEGRFYVLVDDSPQTWSELTGAFDGVIYSWYVADASARAALDVGPGDVGKVAFQEDDSNFYFLCEAGGESELWRTLITADQTSKLESIADNAAALTLAAPADVTRLTAAPGVATTAARADHKHDVSTGVPVAVGSANSGGAATSLARSDHVHDASAKADKAFSINIQAGISYTAILSDAGGALVRFGSGSAATFTIPPEASVAWPTGSVITVLQYGTGQVTVAPGAGVTLRTPLTNKTRGQYSLISYTKVATNEWLASGDLATS